MKTSCWCGRIKPCPMHTRDPRAHKRFAKRVKARDGHRCTSCGSTLDLRAAHIDPVSEGGSYDPSNGTTLCGVCDRASDRYAR